MRLFKSKEEKALEAKLAVRRGINDLRKSNRALEKKKTEMIRFAQEAKQQGIAQQYAVAVSGLKMVMSYQKRCQEMLLQLQMTESMRDLTTMSAGFVKLMGNMGKELNLVVKSTDFAGNQLAFEKGMLAAEQAMGQLEGFMEDAGLSFEADAPEADLDEEIRQLIDQTGAAAVSELDAEIDRRLAESEAKRNALRE